MEWEKILWQFVALLRNLSNLVNRLSKSCSWLLGCGDWLVDALEPEASALKSVIKYRKGQMEQLAKARECFSDRISPFQNVETHFTSENMNSGHFSCSSWSCQGEDPLRE